MSSPRPEEPHLIIRVARARLALPIGSIARLDEHDLRAAVDLGQLCELCERPASRTASIALHTAAGVVIAAVDAVEDVVQDWQLVPLPTATQLSRANLVRGLVELVPPPAGQYAAVLDGGALGDLVALQLHEEQA